MHEGQNVETRNTLLMKLTLRQAIKNMNKKKIEIVSLIFITFGKIKITFFIPLRIFNAEVRITKEQNFSAYFMLDRFESSLTRRGAAVDS